MENLELARRKLQFLERELVLAFDPAAKFSLEVQIEDLKKQIAEIEREKSLTTPTRPQFLDVAKVHTHCDILVLAAQPVSMAPLTLQAETEAIQVEASKGAFPQTVLSVVNSTVELLTRHLLEAQPRILHFAGHGRKGALYWPDTSGLAHEVSPESLAQAVSLSSGSLECVVFNACESLDQAQAFLPFTQAVIIMGREVPDTVARDFSTGFYRAISAGKNYLEAWRFGQAQIRLTNVSSADIPEFHLGTRPGALVTTMRHTNLPDDKGIEYPVFFGTNRAWVKAGYPSKGFSGQAGEELVRGTLKVWVPQSHKLGSLGSPWWKRLLKFEDDRLKVKWDTLRKLDTHGFAGYLSEGLAQWRADQADGGQPQMMVYVHGFNVTFEEAALRAAQIGCDLSLDGMMGFYSWPSRGSVAQYTIDEGSIDDSEKHLLTFLEEVLDQSGDARVNLLAHSMGNRAVLRVLNRLAHKVPSHIQNKKFGRVFFCAPDVGRASFMDQVVIASSMAERATLYASDKDLAVGASRFVHDAPRAGYYEPITIVDGLPTIGAGAVSVDLLGHGYYASARPMLVDLREQLKFDTATESARGLRKMVTPEGKTWWMIPG